MVAWTWTVVAVLAVFLFCITAIFWFVEKVEARKRVLGWLDMLVPLLLGAGSGGSGGALAVAAQTDPSVLEGMGSHLTLQVGVGVGCLLVAVALMTIRAGDDTVRDKLMGYFSTVVPFLIGLGVGGGGALLLL